MKEIKVEIYTTANGNPPYKKWMHSLGARTSAIILRKMTRLEDGNFGDAKSIKRSEWTL